jgi:hypothetical protein
MKLHSVRHYPHDVVYEIWTKFHNLDPGWIQVAMLTSEPSVFHVIRVISWMGLKSVLSKEIRRQIPMYMPGNRTLPIQSIFRQSTELRVTPAYALLTTS